jgi:acylphosphatase
MNARVRVLYSGTVQGVGFRRRALRCADGLGLAGFVRNLADGRVELVAEGPRPRVERLLAAVGGDLGALISGTDVAWSGPSGGLPPFTIVR